MEIIDEFFKSFQKVIKDWGIVEVVFCAIFFPWSAAYVALRVFQEWE